jgi:hypothetical protein
MEVLIERIIQQKLAERDKEWMTRVKTLEKRVRSLESALQSRAPTATLPQVSEDIDVCEETTLTTKRGNGPKCFCCGGITGVHRHRELTIHLDGKCRKQVETLKQGGILTERRELWVAALQNMPNNARAQWMLRKIEGTESTEQNTPSNKRRKIDEAGTENAASGQHECAAKECAECTICQDHLHPTEAALHCELPCRHTFHSSCIIPWLKKKQTCPTCRENVQLQPTTESDSESAQQMSNSLFIDGQHYLVVPGPPLPAQATPCNDGDESQSTSNLDLPPEDSDIQSANLDDDLNSDLQSALLDDDFDFSAILSLPESSCT